MTPVDQQTWLELEAAAFPHLGRAFAQRTDVQNIDLMNLAGFCRNCLAKWYRAAAEEHGEAMSYDEARETGLRHAVRRTGRPATRPNAPPAAKASFEQSHG